MTSLNTQFTLLVLRVVDFVPPLVRESWAPHAKDGFSDSKFNLPTSWIYFNLSVEHLPTHRQKKPSESPTSSFKNTPPDSQHMTAFFRYYDTKIYNSPPRPKINYEHTPATELVSRSKRPKHTTSNQILGPLGMSLTLLPTFLHATSTTTTYLMPISKNQISTLLIYLLHPRLLILLTMQQPKTLS